MGVPKFYRWLSERYPQINQMISDSSLLPEFDNLYLDMNGIDVSLSYRFSAQVPISLLVLHLPCFLYTNREHLLKLDYYQASFTHARILMMTALQTPSL